MTDPQGTEQLVSTLEALLRTGRSFDDAARMMAQFVPEQQIQLALEEIRRRAGLVRSLREPGSIFDPKLESWYIGPQDGDKFWPAYERHLQAKGWRPDAIESLDAASTKVLSLMQHPGVGTIQTRGLVVGYIQSGKTANFTAVVSKAADVGYRFFIVLSGINNALRNQTQGRLNEEIIALNPASWVAITQPLHDFRERTNVNAFLGAEAQGLKILGVVKKTKYRLERLLDWLQGARPEILRNCPVLIIDDEADQASPNSARDIEDRTAVNRLLVALLGALPKAAYVGYTATPFANFLIDPLTEEDLYPRDFIVDLPTPRDYFGTERLFGRQPLDWEEPDAGSAGMNVIREIPAGEIPLLRPAGRPPRDGFRPVVTASLRDAIRYFVMAAAARRVRGQETKHCSMLIHTSQYTAVHDSFEDPIKRELGLMTQGVKNNSVELMNQLRQQWMDEQEKLPSETLGLVPVDFESLRQRIGDVIGSIEVKLEHGASANRIDYEIPGRLYIVIGGNVLSRGLTLEGLTVSYFLRSASAYDTLLQMGRWFGFRPGYQDLPRLWMTRELRIYFDHLAVVEREIRYEIDRYKNKRFSPRDFGPRIRTHPHLAITSKLKMQHSREEKMSFAGKTPQTILFRHKSEKWLEANLRATRTFVSRLRNAGLESVQYEGRPHHIISGVPVDAVIEYLSDYKIHPDQLEMPRDQILGYIRAQNKKGRLKTWNVGVISTGRPNRQIDLGMAQPVGLINRSKYDRRDDTDVDIKALMSERDMAVDLQVPFSEFNGMTREEVLDYRDEQLPDRGLLLIYPIDKNSVPRLATDENRKNLEAVDDVIGLALVFPDPEDNTPQSYVTVDMGDTPVDEIEPEEDNDL